MSKPVNIIKVHQEKDSLWIIDCYKSKVAKLKEKKIDSHSVEYLGDKMREIGTMIKESICEEM